MAEHTTLKHAVITPYELDFAAWPADDSELARNCRRTLERWLEARVAEGGWTLVGEPDYRAGAHSEADGRPFYGMAVFAEVRR